jgi:hypothetical protein
MEEIREPVSATLLGIFWSHLGRDDDTYVMKEVLASVCRPNVSSTLSRYSGISAIGRRTEFSGLTMGAAGSNFSSEQVILLISLGVLGREDGGVMESRALVLREVRATQTSCAKYSLCFPV